MNEEKILLNIFQHIVNELEAKAALSCGLLGGDAGKILFLYECSRFDESLTSKADSLLEKLLQTWRRPPYIMSYCNGFAGFGISLSLLEQEGFIEGAIEHLTEFDETLEYALSFYLINGNIDFLHGATGLGFYFLKRHLQGSDKAAHPLNRLVEYLYDKAVWGIDRRGLPTAKWVFDDKVAIKRYNISLSHGMSSVAILLSRIAKSDLPNESKAKSIEMLKAAGNYLTNQSVDPTVNGSAFPTFPKDCIGDIKKSRLAWCYGDLGVIFALLNISYALDDNKMRQFAIETAKWEAINRKSATDNMVFDACICHGASGVAQAFKTLGVRIGGSCFEDAYRFWRETTLGMCVPKDGDYEFMNYDVANGKWRITNSFLEGNSGVGMMLIGADKILNDILLYDR